MALPKINEISLDDIPLEDNHKLTITSNINTIPSLYSLLKCSKNRSDITSLDACNIHLIKISKGVLLNLVNLSYISLCDNNLRKITKNFLQLKSLISLQLDRNIITSIPPFIKDLHSLEILSLCHNLLTSIPTSIQFCTKLRVLKVSNNKIATLPIEFGLLKQINTLHIDLNYFDRIPTTLCYLKQLNDFKLEWFEFLEPKQLKEQKEGKGMQMISTMRVYLQEMIAKSILFCDFNIFISKANKVIKKKMKDDPFQSLDTEFRNDNNGCNAIDNNAIDIDKKKSSNGTRFLNANIFYAIENNYYGIVKALVQTNEEVLKTKSIDNHLPLYISIAFNYTDITNYLLTKMNMRTFPNAHIFLYKAVRTRNYNLIVQLSAMGIDLNVIDEQGSSLFHLLFSSFNKSIENCCLIGNFLMENKVVGMNLLNFDKWAPVHIAARRGSTACLKWIQLQNSQRLKKNEEIFDLNMRGKNRMTALHLAVSNFFYNETILLLKYGCNLFLKNDQGKTARKVTHNFYLTKLLFFEERKSLYKRYIFTKKINCANAGPKVLQIRHKVKGENNMNLMYNCEDVLENSGASLMEKYGMLKIFKQQRNLKSIEKILPIIMRDIDLSYEKNIVIMTELLDMIVIYNLEGLSPHLERLKMQVKQLNKKNNFLEKVIDNTIKILQSFSKKACSLYNNQDLEGQNDDIYLSDQSEMKTLLYEDNQTDPNYLAYFDEDNDHNNNKEVNDGYTENDLEFFQEMNNTTLVMENNIINMNAPNIRSHISHKASNNSYNYKQHYNDVNSNSYDYISESVIGLDDNESRLM